MQLTIAIDPALPVPLQTQLIGEISTSITNGRLAPGTRLPGTRSLSAQLAGRTAQEGRVSGILPVRHLRGP